MSPPDPIEPSTVLRHVLRAGPPTVRSLDQLIDWRAEVPLLATPDAHPIARAVAIAAASAGLGVAFAAGYWAATETLLGRCGAPSSSGERTSLAVTERAGAHPRAIETVLRVTGARLSLDGEKSFATLADRSTHVLVVAKDARDPDAPMSPHPRLVAVRVPLPHEGLHLDEGVRVPFCPEVSHPVLRFATPASAALTLVGGDAFVDVLQPFRTIEDRAVTASVLAYLLAWGSRAQLDLAVLSRLTLLLSDALLRVSRPDDEIERVVALGMSGILRQTASELVPLFQARSEAFDGGAAFVSGLTRDVALLDVAERLRAARAAKAKAALAS